MNAEEILNARKYGLPWEVLYRADIKTGRNIINKYTAAMRILFEQNRDNREELVMILNDMEMCLAKDGYEEFYLKYKEEYRRYIKLVSEFINEIYKTEQDVGAGNALILMAAELYVIWTNRNAKFPDEIRKATYELTGELAGALKIIVGNDPVLYLYKVVKQGFAIRSSQIIDQIGCLVINVGGYDLTIDAQRKEDRELINALFEDTKTDSFNNNEIIEFMELVERVINVNRDRKQRSWVLGIIDCIIGSKSEELLEIALRKGLISSDYYDETVQILSEKKPEMLPCLIAYRAALRS